MSDFFFMECMIAILYDRSTNFELAVNIGDDP